MLVDVVCMRHRQTRLSDNVLASAPRVRGELTLQNHRGRNQYGERTILIIARLDSAGGGLEVPELIQAAVTNMRGDSFTVSGIEVHAMKPYGSSTSCEQTWLCTLVKE